MTSFSRVAALAAIGIVSTCWATDYGKVSVKNVAPGVLLFTTTSYGVGLSGNAVAIVSDDGVLVYDSNGLPGTAQTVLGKLAEATDKPVRYLVNSHWHWDHWAGNEVYAARFPGLSIIAHQDTRELLRSVEPQWNGEGLKTGLPGYLDALEKKLAEARAAGKTDTKDTADLLQSGRSFLQQKQSLRKILPNLTFGDALTIHAAGRTIEIRHARAITSGDAYLNLPESRIVVTGDILLSPYPYAIGGTYPSSWLATLRHIADLNPSILIPGHGEPQQKEFLERNIRLFEALLSEVRSLRDAGQNRQQCVEAIGKRNAEWAAMLGITDPQIAREFKAYFLDVFASRAHRELEKSLNDMYDQVSP